MFVSYKFPFRLSIQRLHLDDLAGYLNLKLTFAAEKLPPLCIAFQEVLMAAETSAEYIS
jgi:hypothetical protein